MGWRESASTGSLSSAPRCEPQISPSIFRRIAAIETGAMQGWIAQEPRMFGVKGIDAAMDLINGKTVPPVIDIEYQIVTKANLNDPKIQALKN